MVAVIRRNKCLKLAGFLLPFVLLTVSSSDYASAFAGTLKEVSDTNSGLWEQYGFDPLADIDTSYADLPTISQYSFWHVPVTLDSDMYYVAVMVKLSFYDPSTCVKGVPAKYRGILNPYINCWNPRLWFLTRSGRDVREDCDGDCYGIGVACPQSLVVQRGVNGETFLPTPVMIEGFDRKTCIDTGGAIRFLEPDSSVSDNWIVPVMYVDILHDLWEYEWPEWTGERREAILILHKDQLIALSQAMFGS